MRLHLSSMGRSLTALLAIGLLAVGGPARAIPAGGADPDTSGTSASVSPSTLRAGERISFTVSGFPAGEIVYIKIDDGQNCSSSATHGACVYHEQKVTASGRASGSFTIPSDIGAGAHWLRFLASTVIKRDGVQIGTKGYTCRGNSDFTVVSSSSGTSGSGASGSGSSGSGSSGSSSGSSGTGTTTGGGTSASAGSGSAAPTASGSSSVGSGAAVAVQPSASAAAPTSDSTGDSTNDEAATAVTTTAQETTSSSFPWVGTVGLIGLLLLSFAGVRLAMLRHR